VKNRPVPGGNHIARQLEPDVSRRLSQSVSWCSVLVVAFGVWVLTGWALHIQILKSILPGQVAVKANTAVCFILVGVALWFLRKEQPPVASGWKLAAKIASTIASVVGLLSLLEFLWGWDLGIDQLLFRAGPEDIPGSVRPGLMSPIAALGFFWLGPGLLLLHAKSTLGRWSAQLLSAGVAIASVFGIMDFVLDANTTHTYISPITALMLSLISFGLMFAVTQSGLGALVANATLGGTLTRRLLPAAILVPLVIGWARWKGQMGGLYSDWTGVALMTVLCIVLLASLAVWTSFLVDRGDRERRQGEESVSQMASIVTSSNDGIIGKTLDGVVTSWNPGAQAIYGYSAQEIIGQSICVIIPMDRREEFATIMERVKQDEKVSHYETVWVRKDGQTIQVSLSVSPVKDGAGKIVGVSTIARDFTERKRAEEKVTKASLYARSLIEASLDPLVTISKDGKIMDVNRGTELATGISREKLIGSDFSDYFTQPDKARQGYQRVFVEETVRDYPLAIRQVSGRVIDVLYNASVFRNELGEIEGIFAAARDVTEQKRAEEKLRQASLYARSLIEASLDPLVTISREGKITDVNRATETVTGVPRERLIGSDFCDYFTQPEKARQGYEQVFAEGVVRDYPLAIRHSGGRVTDVLYNASVFKNEAGQIEGVFAAARDITERKKVEEELRLSRERLALAQKAAHSGTFDWDIQNNVNRWSAEVEEVYGIAPGEFGGRYEDWEALVVPEDLIRAKKAIEDSLKTGEFAAEWRIRRRNDGEIRWITARANVIFDQAGRPERMLGLNMDVTERKQAEEEVRRLNEELEQRVIQRTAELEAANKELEAFTYSVSHDLRAPLRHISGFSKILSEEYGSTLAPEAQHHLQRIQEGTRRMGLLVDDLLNLGRVGRQEVRLQATGLNSVVNEVVAELQPEYEGRQVEWKIGSLPFVECDPALMKQVFQNLLSNAVKFTRPRSQALIEVGQKDQDGTPVVFVRDNGVGFNMKYAEKLFGVFQRLHRPEDFEGTGVGLATVQRIIQKHGGRIWTEAELDKGTTFYFTLGASEKTELKTKAAMAGDHS
jgi:PAS domain S-box-containing protein